MISACRIVKKPGGGRRASARILCMVEKPEDSTPEEGAPGPQSLRGQAGDVKAEFKSLLKDRNFMKLFWAQLISCMGDWMGTFALMSLVWRMTNSSLAVGGMLAFRVVPALFSGPVAAVISDRLDRRKLMIACDVSRGCIIIFAPFMTHLWSLYTMLFFLEGLSIVWLAARDASIPNLVDEEQLTMANSLSMATTYGVIPFAALTYSLFVFPSPLMRSVAAGSFLARYPTLIAFALDSATFFLSATFFYRMRLESPRDHIDGEQELDIVSSVTFALRNPLARSLLIGAAMGCIGGGSLYAVGIGYVKEVLGARSDAAFGLLMGLFGLGMIAGVVALQVLVKREEKPWMLRVALLVTGGILMGMAFVRVAVFAYILAVFFGAAFGILFIVVVQMVQEGVPDEDRGKAFAAFHAVIRIFLIVGAGLAGGIAGLVQVKHLTILGMHYTLYGISVALFVAGVLIASVSVIPLGGEKKERYREYFARQTSEAATEAAED